MQYQDVSAKPAAGGIDSYSSRAKISEDYVEDALNMDVDASGRWSKRPGYETSMGWLPLRARRFIQDGTSIRVHFDSSQVINLSTVEIGPVIMYGKLPQLTSYGTSSYSDVENIVYFDSFSLVNKDTLSAGTNVITKSAADTGVTSKYVYVGLAQALSVGNVSNDTLMPGLIEIDTATFSIDVEYTATVQSSAYFFYKEKQPEAGSVYSAAWPNPATTMTITAATHGLSNSRLSVKVFSEAGGVATEIIPELVTINTAGDVTIDIESTITGYVILATVPVDNYYASAAVAGVNTFSIPSPPSPLCFYYIYYYDGMTGDRINVIPSLIHYDADTDTTEITYELATGSETVEIYYEEAVSVANIIELTDPSGSATIDTTEGSFVVWGIGHEGVYTSSAPKGGFVHHLDNYRSVVDEHLVAGVNGSLYWRSPFADAPASFLLDTAYVSLNARIDGEQIIGPLFTTADESRTRGNIIDASIVGNKALATAATYVSSGVTNITLSFTNKTGTIASSIGSSDVLLVTGFSNSRNNGSFTILSVVSEDATSAVLQVANDQALNATINETGALARAGVFTDVLTFSAYHRFIPGDILFAEGAEEYTVVATSASDAVVVGGVTSATTYSSNLLVTGSRTGRVLPLRLADNTASVENFVRGDSLVITGVTQKPVVLNSQTGADVTATAVTASGVTTITLSGARTFNEGQYLCIFGDTTDTYNGEWSVQSAPNTTTLTIATPDIEDGSGSFRVLGKCLSLDEAVSWGDAFSATPVYPHGRWLPIEAPTRGDSLVIKDTGPLLFEDNTYANQPNVSSTVVADSMFFANGDDRLFKYDGVNVAQAGLNRNIPSVFMAFDNSVPSILKGFELAYSAASAAGKSFTVGADAFSVGDRIYDSGTGEIFVITSKAQDLANTTWKLIVAGDTSGLTGTGTLTLVKRYRYYITFRLIDINGNILSTNAANSSDMFFDLTEDGRIKIKASYYPPQGFQSFARLEAELYRTLANEPAPFYLTKRLALDMTYSGLTSLEFIDDNDDEFLSQLDAVSSALLQTEIGIGWQPCYRAKSVTTLDNRLIAANLKGWPRFDMTFKPTGVAGTIADLNLFPMLFRKDSDDSSSVPDFENRVGYEFTNASTHAVGPAIESLTFTGADVNTGTGEITKAGADLVTGSAIKFSGSDLPDPLVAGTVYYAVRVSSTTFRVATTVQNALDNISITLNDVGTGTHTLIAAGELYNGTLVRGNSLNTGDWIYLFYSTPVAEQSLAYCGWFQVSVAANDVATLLGWGRGEQTFGAPLPDSYVIGSNGYVPVWLGTDYNYNQVNGNSSGSIELIAARRLADAINFTMTYSQYLEKETYPDFQPWLTAYAGSDYGIGQCVVESQVASSTTPELLIGTLPASMGLFINNLARESDEQIGASTSLYPSRVALSYRNYPELFDRLDGDRSTSDSVVDINPADGQEIVGILPFFGESMFGGANLNQVVLVFKEASAYVLDTTTREYQKLDSRGVGAVAPFSITSARDSVMFASLGSVYRVTRQFTVQNVGKMLTGPNGLWKRYVNQDALASACATNWGQERVYKLSFPTGTDEANSMAFTLHYDREDEGLPPAWTVYDSIPATMYANFGSENYFGSTEGIVFQVRQYGTSIDYRDNTDAISSSVTFRAEDFGLPGVRKSVPNVTMQMDADTATTNIAVKTAVNLGNSFTEAASISLDASTSNVVKCSLDAKRGTHVQVKVEHSVKDEEFSIVGVNYKVSRLTEAGVKQAAETGRG